MSQYHMSVNQRKAHAQAMNRALAESYERLMDLLMKTTQIQN